MADSAKERLTLVQSSRAQANGACARHFLLCFVFDLAVVSQAEVFANHGEQLCELLQNEAGKKIDIQNLFSRFTFDAFSEIAYGAKFDSLHDPNNKFCKAFNVAQALTTERILFPIVKMLGPFGWVQRKERRHEFLGVVFFTPLSLDFAVGTSSCRCDERAAFHNVGNFAGASQHEQIGRRRTAKFARQIC